MVITAEARRRAQELLDFIDASPSPWHAGAALGRLLQGAGFEELREADRWALRTGGRYFVSRGGSSVIAFVVGQAPPDETGVFMVGAHTDSPGLRVKPRAAYTSERLLRLGVEVYGGPILATFTDRDLSLAGRINLRNNGATKSVLVRIAEPLVRLPNLAIHMNRGVNEEGLKLNKQSELPLLLAEQLNGLAPEGRFRGLLAASAGVDAGQIVNWELHVYDTQKGTFWGADQEFIADSQLDNLASCHAGLSALMELDAPWRTGLCGFFDHEEVGSESAKGADGSFLSDVLERMTRALGLDHESYKQALARSFMISADMAHAFHPNFPAAYEPNHQVHVNAGPVIKTNSNQRYATDSVSEAFFISLCESVNIGYQQYAHRTDLGCGSTIGPTIASRLGVSTVDVGNPMWAMHSCRESAGVVDHSSLIQVLKAYWEKQA
ncbi:M18 family aminopeptidase [Methyloterricola oryzae]|uniref:M18 family aminopeptidase n=1 Tax=Methyloterricola oryzae TaxID=1495050 RepID=UPI0005EB5A6B|nr:M18 family aminopeptidase [Methyloterricola oryzae]